MSGVTLFMNYLSAFEEQRYHIDATAIGAWIRRQVCRDAKLDMYCELVKRQVGVDLCDELASPSLLNDSMSAREVQFYLNLAIFRLVETKMEVGALAGYSAGYWQTFVASGAYDPEYFNRSVRPIVMKIRSENLAYWNAGTLASVFLSHPEYCNFNAEIKELMSASEYKGAVFVKDDRPPHSLQIAGEREAVERLWKEVCQSYAGLERYSSKVRRCDSAHIPVKSHDDALSALLETKLNIPRYAIIGSHGDRLTPDQWTPNAAAHLLHRAIYEPLSMSRGARGIRDAGLPVLAIGSERVTRFSFHGLTHDVRPTEIAVLRFSEDGEPYRQELLFSSTPDW
jgi:hypothetical protein